MKTLSKPKRKKTATKKLVAKISSGNKKLDDAIKMALKKKPNPPVSE